MRETRAERGRKRRVAVRSNNRWAFEEEEEEEVVEEGKEEKSIVEDF